MVKVPNKLLRLFNIVNKIIQIYFTLIFFTKKVNMKLFSGIVGGFFLALLGAIVTASLIVSFSKMNGLVFGSMAFLVLWITGTLTVLMSKSTGKAWRRILFASAFFSFCLPMAGLFYTSASVAGIIEKGGEFIGTSATATAILGTFLSAIMGILGFFLGAFFLMIGLLVGRNKCIEISAAPPTIN